MTLIPRPRRDGNIFDWFIRPAEDLIDELDKLVGFEIPKVSWTMPMVNSRDVEGGTEVEVAAPGLDKDDFEISVEGNRLRISVSNKADIKDYVRREFNYSTFVRNVNLPVGVNTEDITARYHQGLLIVFVPFEDKPERIKVTVK
jgi:HSP20 family protein